MNSLWDKFWKDKNGKVPISERPNPPLIAAFMSMFLTFFLPEGHLKSIMSLIAFGAWFTWAWLELFQGSAYFRRTIGLIVLIIIVYNRI